MYIYNNYKASAPQHTAAKEEMECVQMEEEFSYK